jgi:DNA-binding NtrC family response regulator
MTMPEDDIRMAAATHVPVLITCDSAPERERCARLIHGQSRGNDGLFVTCRGNRSLRQPFDQARSGTLFIEDLVALSADAQLELLSLLNERIRQGSECAVRILAGASRHLDAERRSGAFSERLFYRLNLIHLHFKDEQSIRVVDMATTPRARSGSG